MKLSPGNAQHIGAREEQQDSFGFSDLDNSSFVSHAGVVAVVADGMGGMARGDAASKAAVRAFLGAYQTKSTHESIPQAMDRALREANRAVVHLARSADLEDGMGTTLAAAAVHNELLYWISAGDSRVYLLRGGELAKLTSDHVYANELQEDVAQGKISRADALSNSQRGDLTSYLGLPELPAVDRNMRPFPIRLGESVILCSDGLYKAMPGKEIAQSFQGDTQSACEGLVRQVLAKRLPHQDNVTVIALTCSSDSTTKRDVVPKVAIGVSAASLAALLAIGGFWWLKPPPPTSTTASTATHPASDNGGPATSTPEPPAIVPPTVTPNPGGGTASVVSAAKVFFSPPELDFGDKILNQSGEKDLTIKNNQPNPLRILTVKIGGKDSGDFLVKQPNCEKKTLPPNQDCKITISFKPKSAGNRETIIVVTASNKKQYTAVLKGAGQPESQDKPLILAVEPINIDFGEQSLSTISKSRPITLRNDSKVQLSISVPKSESDFQVEPGSCGVSLAPDAHCEIRVTFTPSVQGQREAFPVITANGKPHKFSLFGTGVPPATTAESAAKPKNGEGSKTGIDASKTAVSPPSAKPSGSEGPGATDKKPDKAGELPPVESKPPPVTPKTGK